MNNLKEEVRRLISEDNVDELSKIHNTNENLRTNFNSIQHWGNFTKMPLLHFAVLVNSQKVVEYLLSQDFVDKNICNAYGENIYHIVCSMRGADKLFSMIERNVPHHLLLNKSRTQCNVFQIACERNDIFIVKRVHELMESLKVGSTQKEHNNVIYNALNNRYREDVLEYVTSIDGISCDDFEFFQIINSSMFDIVVNLLNNLLRISIPPHFRNQFHIFQFSHHLANHYFNKNNNNNNNNNNNKIFNNENRIWINDNNDHYLKLVEENFKKIIMRTSLDRSGNRIWHEICRNENLDVVQLIFSLKEIQPEILNNDGYNVFLIACEQNSNIKVIKYIHKLFPSLFHSRIKDKDENLLNGACLVIENTILGSENQLKIIHYLYLNGIDIHILAKEIIPEQTINITTIKYQSIYSLSKNYELGQDMEEYLKVISQDFDYQNEHDDEAYRKPSFWKQIDHNNSDEQSIRINEWKNRFDEHVLHHLSKMIQEWML